MANPSLTEMFNQISQLSTAVQDLTKAQGGLAQSQADQQAVILDLANTMKMPEISAAQTALTARVQDVQKQTALTAQAQAQTAQTTSALKAVVATVKDFLGLVPPANPIP